MRLVCPNCGAQYEVDDRVIPDGGRDVQCSACGHGWYQMPVAPAEDLEQTLELTDRLAPEEDAQDHDDGGFEEGLDEAFASGPDAEDEAPAQAESDGPEMPEAPRRELDAGVRDILREEAERELARRAEERKPEPVETQPDLGLDEGGAEEERRRIARERMARLRGLEDDETDEVPPAVAAPPARPQPHSAEPEEAKAAQPRRELFPDIEEINSTLERRGTAPATGTAEPEPVAGGFGRGFMAVVLVAVVALAVYILAPTLALRLPALEPGLSAYVSAVNDARSWLDGLVQGLIASIETQAAG